MEGSTRAQRHECIFQPPFSSSHANCLAITRTFAAARVFPRQTVPIAEELFLFRSHKRRRLAASWLRFARSPRMIFSPSVEKRLPRCCTPQKRNPLLDRPFPIRTTIRSRPDRLSLSAAEARSKPLGKSRISCESPQRTLSLISRCSVASRAFASRDFALLATLCDRSNHPFIVSLDHEP